MIKKVAFPGSFDPLTKGHLDIIQRAYPFFDNIIVALTNNPSKKCTFTLSERKNLIQSTLNAEGLSEKVEVLDFRGLLVNFLKEQQISLIIRGIRALSDFEFEFRTARINSQLAPDIETMFILSSPAFEHISSSLVKELCQLGGNSSLYLPESIVPYCIKKLSVPCADNQDNPAT